MYGDTKEVKNTNGKRYYSNAIYPDIPYTETDLYVITTVGDRLDVLAEKYYKDISLYKVIATANNLTCDSLYPPVGMILRIPTNLDNIRKKFVETNNVR